MEGPFPWVARAAVVFGVFLVCFLGVGLVFGGWRVGVVVFFGVVGSCRYGCVLLYFCGGLFLLSIDSPFPGKGASPPTPPSSPTGVARVLLLLPLPPSAVLGCCGCGCWGGEGKGRGRGGGGEMVSLMIMFWLGSIYLCMKQNILRITIDTERWNNNSHPGEQGAGAQSRRGRAARNKTYTNKHTQHTKTNKNK